MIGSNRVMAMEMSTFVFFGVVVEFYGASGTENSERKMDGRHVELYVVSGTERIRTEMNPSFKSCPSCTIFYLRFLLLRSSPACNVLSNSATSVQLR